MQVQKKDIKVDIKSGDTTAVIEGKTAVPFKTFVALILQRKVTSLFKDWGNEPVIVNSEMLTKLASAPQDTTENKVQLVTVTLGTGILCGIFVFAIAQIVLTLFGVTLGSKELLFIAGLLVVVAGITNALSKMQKKNKGEKVLEAMERLAQMTKK